MNGSRTADSSGSISSSSSVCSRVEQIRRTKGVGYIGLNVSEQDLENWDPNDDRAIVWFDIGEYSRRAGASGDGAPIDLLVTLLDNRQYALSQVDQDRRPDGSTHPRLLLGSRLA